MPHSYRLLISLSLLLLTISQAEAHFLWILQHNNPDERQVELVFGEVAEADDPDLLTLIKDANVWQLDADGTTTQLKLQLSQDRLFTPLNAAKADSLIFATHDYGILERGGESFALKYYAATGPAPDHQLWSQPDAQQTLPLQLIPRLSQNGLSITVLWNGKPVSGAQLIANGPGMSEVETETNDLGQVTFETGDAGLYSIRARHIEERSGKHEDQSFDSVRHYSTLALPVDLPATPRVKADRYPPLPEPVTSFGAAIVDQHLYVYGGHTGQAHQYWDSSQANTLRRLDLKTGKGWQSLGTSTGLQGLAMVAHQNKLYRIGGFIAKNNRGEEHDLWSQSNVDCYDPTSARWTPMPDLPEPRSSFDAAVLGNKIYVVGGWKLSGPDEHHWHTTAYTLDLSLQAPQWQPLPAPPFQRRALSLAAHQGKIFVIGGMQSQGGPTTRVDIFDPVTQTWSQAPDLLGEPMDGFGPAAFATGGQLYVTTYSGKVQQLAQDGKSWLEITQLERARFFHRMLPLAPNQLILVGGANMDSGKFDEVDVLSLEPSTTDQ